MTDDARIRAALAIVLADPVLARSPVLARLLRYLVDAAISGQGKTLKSYSVAVDGLGKSPDFDAQADSYARVQVARLRRALDAFYADAGAHLSQRLLIDSGSYEVRLVPNDGPGMAPPVAFRRRFWLDSRLLALGLVAAMLLAVMLVMHWQAESVAAAERWKVSNFPFVDVSVTDETVGETQTDLTRQIRQSIIMNLDNYEGIRVSYTPTKNTDYSIHVTLRKSKNGYTDNILVTENRSNRLIWSNNSDLKFESSDKELSSDRFLTASIFYIAHPTGIIHSTERKRNYPIDSPYGCWLRFTALLQSTHTVGDDGLAECAQNWHSAAPNHPLASALYGWTLIDRSISRITEAGRRETIQNAVDVLESAKAMNPNSPFLQVAAMRAYAFAGNSAAMHTAAAQALRLSPDNLDIQGAAGMMLTLGNDPQGEVLLNRAIAAHFNPPPWYFVGKFIAAMMRQDPAGAGQALDQLKALQHSLPVLPILSAAYESRIGHQDRACAAWHQAVAMQPVLRIRPDAFLVRLPMASAVRVRLLEWLNPVPGRNTMRC